MVSAVAMFPSSSRVFQEKEEEDDGNERDRERNGERQKRET